jgi:hypothetical protein
MTDLQVLSDMRSDVLREMPDTVTIRRQSGFTVDPVTLIQEPAFTDVAVGVRASVVRKQSRLVQQGEGGFDVETYAVHIPHTVDGVRTGDTVTVVACTDSDAEGRMLAVKSVTFGTFGASRRLECEEQESGVHQIVPEVGS